MTEKTGRLVDRYTARYERFYSHPVGRVWTALTTGSSIDAWMMPTNTIESRGGGRFWMSFTEAADAGYHGTIEEFRENELVDYAFDNGEHMRFEIEPAPGGTKLVFIHTLTPEVEAEMGASMDVPFQQGLLAGWHMCLDRLDGWLSGDSSITPERALAESKQAQAGEYPPEMRRLIELYASEVKTTSGSPSRSE